MAKAEITVRSNEKNMQPGEQRWFTFNNTRSAAQALIAATQDEGFDPTFIRELASKMPSVSRLCEERVAEKFGAYIDDVKEANEYELFVCMREIAGMDSNLCRRIEKRVKEMMSSLATQASIFLVESAKNPQGQWVVRIQYNTSIPPKDMEFNSYNKEEGIRTTWCKNVGSEQTALTLAQFLAGQLDVRHLHDAS